MDNSELLAATEFLHPTRRTMHALELRQNRIADPALQLPGELHYGNVPLSTVKRLDALRGIAYPQLSRTIPQYASIENCDYIFSAFACELDSAGRKDVAFRTSANVCYCDMQHRFYFLSVR